MIVRSAPLNRERLQLDLFRSVPGTIAPRDAQDLMAWPFFSLAKSRRTTPIEFRMGETWISVEAVPEHGMATIWDADILIWAASQLVEARDARVVDIDVALDAALPPGATAGDRYGSKAMMAMTRI